MTQRSRTRLGTHVLLAAFVVALTVVAMPAAARAQSAQEKYTTRLEWVPIAGTDRVSGKGSATATLSGKTLAISGSFEGLGGAATVMRLHQGIARGARGKAIADIAVPKAPSGTFAATVTLTDE